MNLHRECSVNSTVWLTKLTKKRNDLKNLYIKKKSQAARVRRRGPTDHLQDIETELRQADCTVGVNCYIFQYFVRHGPDLCRECLQLRKDVTIQQR